MPVFTITEIQLTP